MFFFIIIFIGMNKPGGVAVIKKKYSSCDSNRIDMHPNDDLETETAMEAVVYYDVDYVLGGSERRVQSEWITAFDMCEHTTKRRR